MLMLMFMHSLTICRIGLYSDVDVDVWPTIRHIEHWSIGDGGGGGGYKCVK